MIFQKNIPLKKYSNYKIGGPASFFVEFNSAEKLKEILLNWREINGNMDNIFILGEGTNILFNDSGFEGLVIKNNLVFLKKEKNLIDVGSGTGFSKVIEYYAQVGLSGLEWAGGLPGTVGAAVRGNAGAFGGETKDIVLEVESLNIKTLKIKKRNNADCNFSYRDSIFKSGEGKNEIILSAKFKFKKGILKEIKKNTQEKIDYRIERHPLDLPNIGSIFKNVPVRITQQGIREVFKNNIKNDPFPVIPAAKFLAGSGISGRMIGGAKISEKQPNYIVNFKNAKAEDVKKLITFAKKKVWDKYGVSLEEEITIVP